MNSFEAYPDDRFYQPTEYTLWSGGTAGSVSAPGIVEELGDDKVTFLIGTADSGSENGRLRELVESESGVSLPALSDIRKVMSAVGGKGNTTNQIFEVRLDESATFATVEQYNRRIFERANFSNRAAKGAAENALDIAGGIAEHIINTDGTLKGHMVGNIAMAGLFLHYDGDLGAAVRDASSWLQTRAQVLPISNDPYHLVMDYKGATFVGERIIDELDLDEPQLADLSLVPVIAERGIELYEPARQAIIHGRNSLLQGSYHTTQGSALLVPGTATALQQNKYPFSAVANLESGRDTRGLSLEEYVLGLAAMAGRSIDLVIRNQPETLPEGKVALKYDEGRDLVGTRVITTALLDSSFEATVDANDPIAHLRSDVRTNGRQVARVLSAATVDRLVAAA